MTTTDPANDLADLRADFDAADAELLRFAGYVEPGDDGWDLLYEASVNGADDLAAEALDEATSEAGWQLRRLSGEIRAGECGELAANDVDAAVEAYRAQALGVVRAALAGRGGR